MTTHFKRWLSFILVLCFLFAIPATANASSVFPDDLYLQQSTYGTCTLTSAAMMIRARMYLSNNNYWTHVTENDVRYYGWLEGAGLYWNWTYTIQDCRVSIKREQVSEGFTIEELKELLDKHPEGIVLYVDSVPHAVFITDYEGDTFYCADPASYYSGKRIPLAESYTASRVGDQDAVLANTYSYWYVSSYSIPECTEDVGPAPDFCECSTDAAGEYICTSTNTLNIRSGHSTVSTVIGSIPSGAVVNVTMANDEWAHVEYNGIKGFASLDYLRKSYIEGDMDNDGKASNSDIVVLVRYIVGLLDTNSETAIRIQEYGDLNSDGVISNSDLLAITRIVIGL